MLVTGTYIYIVFDFVEDIVVNDGCPSFEVVSATVLVGDQGEPLDLFLITLTPLHGTRAWKHAASGHRVIKIGCHASARPRTSVEDFVVQLEGIG